MVSERLLKNKVDGSTIKRFLAILLICVLSFSSGFVWATNTTTISANGIVTQSVTSNDWINGLGANVSGTLTYPVSSFNYVISTIDNGTHFIAKNGFTGQVDFTSTSLVTVINYCESVLSAGSICVMGANTESGRYLLNGTVILSPKVELWFLGGIYDVFTSNYAFYGNAPQSAYFLYLDAVFYVYNSTMHFIHLENSIYDEIYINVIGAYAGYMDATAVYLTGDPCYYNQITINYVYDIRCGIDFPTAFGNANTIHYITMTNVYYGIHIPHGSDNVVERCIVTGGGIKAGGSAIYIGDGSSNDIYNCYGEYGAGTGYLIYLDTGAQGNFIHMLKQEGFATNIFYDANPLHNYGFGYGFENFGSTVIPAYQTSVTVAYNLYADANSWTVMGVDNATYWLSSAMGGNAVFNSNVNSSSPQIIFFRLYFQP